MPGIDSDTRAIVFTVPAASDQNSFLWRMKVIVSMLFKMETPRSPLPRSGASVVWLGTSGGAVNVPWYWPGIEEPGPRGRAVSPEHDVFARAARRRVHDDRHGGSKGSTTCLHDHVTGILRRKKLRSWEAAGLGRPKEALPIARGLAPPDFENA